MKYVKLALVVLLLTSFSTAEVFYSVDADSKSLRMESSAKLECTPEPEGQGCPVSRWTAKLSVPTSAEITDVTSENGEVLDYERSGKTLTVETQTLPTNSELIKVNYVINRNAERVTEGLYTRSISLPGFSGQETSGTLNVKDFISGRISSGFQYSVKENEVNFTGTGATNFVAAFGEGEETKYFEFFGGKTDNPSKAYRIAVGTLGVANRFDRFPVAVISSGTYNETVNRWSAGQYTNATIYMRDNLGKDQMPILAHEAVHGLNDQTLNWETSSAWFDEGTAKYVEFLVRKSKGDYTREVFGEPVTYTKEEDGRRYRYTLSSKGDADQLWAYYENGDNWMKHWSPRKGNRDFGYAYSELVIKNYVRNNGSLRELYAEIDNTEYETDGEKWRELSQHLDVTPCKYESRDRFDKCLEAVNDYDYPVYSATDIRAAENSLVVEELKVEPAEPKSQKLSGVRDTTMAAQSWFQKLLDFLGGFLNS